MKTYILTLICLFISFTAFGQKKVLDHPDFEIWNTIQGQRISRDGQLIIYSLEKGEADNHLKIKDGQGNLVFDHERSEGGQFTFDSDYALFTIKAWQSDVRELKRDKVKSEDMPNDTLAIFNPKNKSLLKIPHVRNYKLPVKWGGYVAYQLEAAEQDKDDKSKKASTKNGYHVVVRNLSSGSQDTIKYVTDYRFAEEGKTLAFITTGDEVRTPGVYIQELTSSQPQQVFSAEKGKYSRMTLSKSGERLAFVADLDTTKVLVRPNALYTWTKGMSQAQKIVDAQSAPKDYRVSSDGNLSFSKDESKLYFGLATAPVLQDTSLIDEEIVNVEVWTYDEPRLYTVQELQVENDKRKSYLTAIHLNQNNKLVQLATTEYPDASLGNEGNAAFALINTSLPYELQSQWEGGTYRDYALVNVSTGAVKKVMDEIRGGVSFSPATKYAFGYSSADSTWFTYNIASGKRQDLTKGCGLL